MNEIEFKTYLPLHINQDVRTVEMFMLVVNVSIHFISH